VSASGAALTVLAAVETATEGRGSGSAVRDVLTAYAALVSTAVLCWQMWTWRQQRRPVEVCVKLGCIGYPEGPVWAVSVEASNRSDHAVNVRSAGLVMDDGSEWTIVRPLDVSELPGEVKPRDAGAMAVRAEHVQQHFDLLRPVVGWVRLATGEVVRSKAVTLLSGSAELPI
jgi:hypothetical protein